MFSIHPNFKAILLWAVISWALLVCPGQGGYFDFLNGLPCNHIIDFICAIALFAGIFAFAHPLSQKRIFYLLIGLCLCGGAMRYFSFYTGYDYGLAAVYRYESKPGKWEMVRSIDSPSSSISKIETCMNFAGLSEGFNRTPMWSSFLNQVDRDHDPKDRLQHRLEIRWEGFITPNYNCDIVFQCSGNAKILTPVSLKQGESHPLIVEARFDSLQDIWIRLSVAGNDTVVPSNWLTLDNPRPGILFLFSQFALWCSHILLLLVAISGIRVVYRAWGTFVPQWKFIGYGAILFIALFSGAILWEYQLSVNPNFSIIPCHDYLIYAHEARSFLLNGFYHDDPYPFHRSAAMRYYIAACYLIFGDNGYGIALWHQMLRGFTAIFVVLIWNRLSDMKRMGWLLGVLILFLPKIKYTLRYWPDVPSTFLFALLCLCFVMRECATRKTDMREEESDTPSKSLWWMALAGVGGGLFTLMRTNAMVFLMITPFWMLYRKYKWNNILAFVLCFMTILSFVPIRNYLVTGKWAMTSTHGPLNLVLGNNIPKDIQLPVISTGDPARDKTFYEGIYKLLDAKNNPDACCDVFGGEANYYMQKPLTQVFFAYVRQRPFHFMGQVLRKTQTYFFPIDVNRLVFVFTIAMLGSIYLFVRSKQFGTWATLTLFVFLYSAPLMLAKWEDRYRAVMLPEMVMIGWYSLVYVMSKLKCCQFLEKIG